MDHLNDTEGINDKKKALGFTFPVLRFSFPLLL